MKQHITRNQFDDLTRESKLKYIKWCMDKGYENHRCSECGPTPQMWSIGQMIEFLDENLPHPSFFLTRLECHGNLEWSTGSMTCRANHYSSKSKEFYDEIHENDKELCDALWVRCKEALQ